MPSFQIGDIFAKIGIDIQPLQQAASQAIRVAKQIATGINSQLSKVSLSGSLQGAVLKAPSTSQFVAGITAAASSIKQGFQAAFSSATNATKSFTSGAGKVLSGIAAPAKVAISAVGGIAKGVTGLISSIFSLKGLLTGFGAFKLIERAVEVEALQNAFENLTSSVGILANTFLPKLRQATRGTISDLDLFRVTNNAILLGIVKDENAFLELAGAARRLGQAVGKNATDALDDLVLGIARQSRRILDNLGIIVSAEAAYKNYAAALKIVGRELTIQEKQDAFTAEALRKVRERVNQLGVEVLTTAEAWGRLQASVSNTFSAIATSTVGGGPFIALADFLDKNRKSITAFAAALAEVGSGIAKRIGKLVSEISELGFGGIVSGLVDFVTSGISIAIRASARIILETLKSLFTTIGPPLLDIIVRTLIKLVSAIGREIANALINSFKSAATGVADIFGLPVIGASLIKGKADQAKALIDKAFDPEELLKGFNAKFDKSGQQLVDGVVGLFSKGASIIGEEISKEKGKIQAFLDDVVKLTDAARKKVPLNKADPLFGERRQIVLPILQPVADGIAKLAELRRKFLEFRALGKGDRAGIVDEREVRNSAAVIDLLNKGLQFTNSLLFKIKEGFKVGGISAAEFETAIAPLREKRDELRIEVDTAGLGDAATKAAKFGSEIDKIRARTKDPALLKELDDLQAEFGELFDISAARAFDDKLKDVSKSIRDAREELDQPSLSPLERQVISSRRDIQEDPALSQEQRNRLLLANQNQLADARAVESRRRVQEFTKETSDAFLGGIADAFARGEKLSKGFSEGVAAIWQNALKKTIENISEQLSVALGKIFEGLPGLGGAVGAVGLGLVGIGGAILSNISAKKSSTVKDFSEAVNSSEAVRGIVAGPTNVAIAKVGDELKSALRVTEELLQRIAISVERGGGGGATQAAGNFNLRLTPSTTS